MRAEFSENLITGNELIDSQHKELIDRINKLLDSCEDSDAKLTLSVTVLPGDPPEETPEVGETA